MGFDIHGMNPTIRGGSKPERPSDEVLYSDQDVLKEYFAKVSQYEQKNPGIYFRRNVWGWRPLWECVYSFCDNIISEEEYDAGGFNDGHEISAEQATEIADVLTQRLDSGAIATYVERHEQERKALPPSECSRCKGSGEDPDSERDPCRSCEGKGKTPNFGSYYSMEVSCVEEFRDFCKDSGGFQIF
jgi:hypothetical protein